MKRITVALAAFFLTLLVSAQFHLEVGLNYNSLFSKDQKNIYDFGVGAFIEPKYTLNANIDLGLLIGISGFARTGGLIGPVPNELGVPPRIIPMVATCTYRILEDKWTPYVGVALGYYRGKVNAGESRSAMIENSFDEFGFSPRAGIYLGKLDVGFAYNIVPSVSFLQFNIGFRIFAN